MKSFLVEIQERFGEGAFWTITSKHLPGLFLGGQDLDALRKDLPEAIRLLFLLNYKMKVEVRFLITDLSELEHSRPSKPLFAAFPLAA
ncbi:MAG: hypothetical protein ACHBNF_09525 [Chromatiales bacterium]